jgi:hypothetical protein
MDLVLDFLDDPTEPPDDGCVARAAPLAFTLDAP